MIIGITNEEKNIRNINDITDDPVEQYHFVRKVQSCGGRIVSIYDGQIAWNDEE